MPASVCPLWTGAILWPVCGFRRSQTRSTVVTVAPCGWIQQYPAREFFPSAALATPATASPNALTHHYWQRWWRHVASHKSKKHNGGVVFVSSVTVLCVCVCVCVLYLFVSLHFNRRCITPRLSTFSWGSRPVNCFNQCSIWTINTQYFCLWSFCLILSYCFVSFTTEWLYDD